MNILQLKTDLTASLKVPITQLTMVRQFEEDKSTPTPWLSHWDNDNRIRVTMHEDILKTLKENPKFPGLAYKKEIVEATEQRAAYTRIVVITPRNIEATF